MHAFILSWCVATKYGCPFEGDRLFRKHGTAAAVAAKLEGKAVRKLSPFETKPLKCPGRYCCVNWRENMHLLLR